MNYGSLAPLPSNQPLNAYTGPPYLGRISLWAWGSVANNPTKPSGSRSANRAVYSWQNGPWIGFEGDIQATAPRTPFSA